ncbi:hypothetical protein GCM10007071_24480 [Marinobacter zhanjiangensis]|uniref:Uncharacterized protein n=1 Tax=Marinobacter zhanjiangensis TaxID=578215 RepID=A0ABQ3B373_9GAMM|nr:hypothetical protein GCM10007071_24480 [Marinobacter zhanjiangensis]
MPDIPIYWWIRNHKRVEIFTIPKKSYKKRHRNQEHRNDLKPSDHQIQLVEVSEKVNERKEEEEATYIIDRPIITTNLKERKHNN